MARESVSTWGWSDGNQPVAVRQHHILAASMIILLLSVGSLAAITGSMWWHDHYIHRIIDCVPGYYQPHSYSQKCIPVSR